MKTVSDSATLTTPEYRQFIEDLKARVTAARISAARAVNRDLILPYWDIIKGFALDDERLKQGGGGNYFEELLHKLMTAQIRVHDLDLEGLLAQAAREFGDSLSLELRQAVAEMENTS